jgi:membrane fusion protein, copper/silver efflux system
MKRILFITLALFAIGGCQSEHKKEVASTTHQHIPEERYTCPMHPAVVSQKPGTCSICGMALVKSVAHSNASLMLTDSQIKLANIRTQKITHQEIGQAIAINGRFVVNQQNSMSITARASGRIEKLFIKETGQSAKSGQPLYEIYSEMLLTVQQEYLLAKDQFEKLGNTETRYKTFYESARQKLILYGLTNAQINQLSHASRPSVIYLAPTSGVVVDIAVAEGESVVEGSQLYKIERLDKLWIEAELYSGESSNVNVGDPILVTLPGEQDQINAVIEYLSPEFRANTQVTLLRATIANEHLKYRPGQQAKVYLNHPTKTSVTVPTDGVIRDESGSHVYRQHGHNSFEPVRVTTGLENVDQTEIIEGISEGDTVVISGAYLLYSEFKLKKGDN